MHKTAFLNQFFEEFPCNSHKVRVGDSGGKWQDQILQKTVEADCLLQPETEEADYV